jgi:hypothetical protein
MALAKPSALPAAQQRRRETIVSLHGDPAVVVDPVVAAVPTADPVVDPVVPAAEAPVTMTQAEAAELRAAAADVVNARRAAEIAVLEASEAKARLTDAERARNEQSQVIAPLDLGFDASATEFTPAERETFDELSEAFVVKVVRRELAAAFQKYGLHLDGRLAGIEKAATTATVTVQRAAEKNFMARVQEKITDVAQLVGHANFKSWMKEYVPMTSTTFDQALAEAHQAENLQAVIDIFDVFRKKVGLAKPSTAGYAGAAGSAALVEPAAAASGERFTMTERKKKSEQLRKKQISQQEFDKYKAEFDKANEEGRVDP